MGAEDRAAIERATSLMDAANGTKHAQAAAELIAKAQVYVLMAIAKKLDHIDTAIGGLEAK